METSPRSADSQHPDPKTFGERKKVQTPETVFRWHRLPLLLITGGALSAWGVALTPGLPVEIRWILTASGLLSLCGIFAFRRELSDAEASAAAERKALEEKRAKAEKAEREFERELEKRILRLREKEEALSRKLMTFHEWMEFPIGIESETDISPESQIPETDYQRKDQAVYALLKERTDRAFERIKTNYYYRDGEFAYDRIRTELLDLVTSVARIYNPDSKNPLLETSVEQLLKSANRTALQLLVLLETLPLDIKSYNLTHMYEMVQTGVRAYGAYKNLDACWTYLRPAYYLGRFALGSNPVTLGVTWLIGELAKTGAKKVSSRAANQYALKLLFELIIIIGNESAAVFGGDFRRREANWIYGAELTDLIRRFPLSEETLRQSLKEVGRLRLRCEYDRIFLYRSLAAHKSAGPHRFDAVSHLPMTERQTIARRLEKFAKTRYAEHSPEDLEKWKKEAQDRLGIHLSMEGRKGETEQAGCPDAEKTAQGIFSLAGFLIDIKSRSPQTLEIPLAKTRLGKRLEKGERIAVLDALTEAPPMIFDYPDWKPDDPLLEDYLADLSELAVQPPVEDDREMKIVEETALYFRREDILKKIDKKRNQAVEKQFRANLEPGSPEKKVPPFAAMGILSALDYDETLRFIYRNLIIERGDGTPLLHQPYREKALWLLGTDRRLLLMVIPEKKKAHSSDCVLWEGFCEGGNCIRLERISNRLIDDCRITGGSWAESRDRSIRAKGSAASRYHSYFECLEKFCF